MASVSTSATPSLVTISSTDKKRHVVPPIYKVGLVLVREGKNGELEFCLTETVAKNPEEQDQIDPGLPKGTRRYVDSDGVALGDARDAATAIKYRKQLEPLLDTLCLEADEEIGLPQYVLRDAKSRILELGARPHASRKPGKEPFDVQWYVVKADRAMTDTMVEPSDARRAFWETLPRIKTMEAYGSINSGYVRVMEEVAEKLNALKPTQFLEPEQRTR